jgi:hypothetical protein
MSVSYQETEWRSVAALFWRRLLRGMKAPDGFEHRPGGAFVKPAFAALLLIICAGALALYVFRSTRESAPTQLAADKQQQPSVKQSGSVVVARNTNDAPPNGGVSPASVAGTATTTQNATGGHRGDKSSRSETMLATIRKHTAIPTQATLSNPSPRQATSEQARVASSRTNAETESSPAAAVARQRDSSDTTRSVESNAAATALAKVRKVFIEVTGEHNLSEQTSRLLATRLRDGQRLTPTDVKDEADAAFKIKVSGRTPAGASQGEQASRDSDAEKRSVKVLVRLVNEDGEVIWPANSKGNGGVYTGTVGDVTKRIAGDLLKDVLNSDSKK